MPIKNRGFGFGVFSQSKDKKGSSLGDMRFEQCGKAYRFARAGAADIPAGRFVVGVTNQAAHQNEAILAAVPVGTYALSVTVTAGTAIVANELENGEFLINDGAGEGHSYEIDSNTAISASGTVVYLTLKRPIKVALDTTSEFTLVRNPMYGLVQSATQTLPLGGITPIAVTANYYFWVQTKGMAPGYCTTTVPVIGQEFAQEGVAGGITVSTSSDTIPDLGQCLIAAAATEYSALWLNMD
uniref:Uncharacterized protein n=1 Tax=viral metagenome TaxID=1070528 RepID=A0A6M3L3Y1_9ZZZZ